MVYNSAMFIVTGASSGIGRATAEALAQRGKRVLAVARTQSMLEQLQEIAPELIVVVQADLSTDVGIEQVLRSSTEHSQLGGIVHAAGSNIPPKRYADLDAKELLADMAVHVSAPIALNNGLLPKLQGGRVLYIDSYSSTIPRVGWSGYSIVKAAAQMAARSAAAELDGVHVVRAFPGGVRTALVEAVLQAEEESPAVRTFRNLEKNGEIIEPAVAGEYLASIMLDASVEQLAERKTWSIADSVHTK